MANISPIIQVEIRETFKDPYLFKSVNVNYEIFGDIFIKIFQFIRILYNLYTIFQFLDWKNFTPLKLGEMGLQKIQNGKSLFLKKNMEK